MSDNPPIVIAIVVSVIISGLASNRIGFVGGIDKVQQEAVLKGHAEWVADQSGKPVFKWKEAKP
jgi:hypothetical protein